MATDSTDSTDCFNLGEGSALPLLENVKVLQERGPIHVLKANFTEEGKARLESTCPSIASKDEDETDKPVLVKFVTRVKSEDDEATQNVMKMEIDILRGLPPSPLVNRFLCCMKTLEKEGFYSYWMVSEYLDGPDIFNWLIRSDACKDDRAYKRCLKNGPCIFWLAFLTLGVLHKHGIYHRDIKLENFIVRKPSQIKDFPSWDVLGLGDPDNEFSPLHSHPFGPNNPDARVVPTLIDFGGSCVWTPFSSSLPSTRATHASHATQGWLGTCKIAQAGTHVTADPYLYGPPDLIARRLKPNALALADYFSLAIVICMFYTKVYPMQLCRLPDGTLKPLLALAVLVEAKRNEPFLFSKLSRLSPTLCHIVKLTLGLAADLSLVKNGSTSLKNYFVPTTTPAYIHHPLKYRMEGKALLVETTNYETVKAAIQSPSRDNKTLANIYFDISLPPIARSDVGPAQIRTLLGITPEAEAALFPTL